MITQKPGANQPQFLFIQPLGTPHDGTVPYGLIGAINNIEQPKLGIYDYQLTPELAAAARVIAISIHWYHSLAPALELARYLRPLTRARIVTGGYTAHVFASILRNTGVFDAVLTGPAESQLPAYCRGDRLTNHESAAVLDQDIFNTTDYFCVDWFPDFFCRQKMEWPVLPITKGPCRVEKQEKNGYCRTCYARSTAYQYFFPHCPEIRHPENVQADLERLSRDSRRREVYLYHDPFSLPGNPYSAILEHKYQLILHLYPTTLYTEAFLERLRACFHHVYIYFYCRSPEIFTSKDGRRFLAACRGLQIPVISQALHSLPAQLPDYLSTSGVTVRNNSLDTLSLPSPFTRDKHIRFREFYNRSVKFFLEKNLYKYSPVYMEEVDNWLEDRTIHPGRFQNRAQEHPVDSKDGIELKIEAGAGLPDSVYAVFYLYRQNVTGKIIKINRADVLSPPLPIVKLSYRRCKPCFVITSDFKQAHGGLSGGVISFRRGIEVFHYGLYLPLPPGTRELSTGQLLYLEISTTINKAAWELIIDRESQGA